MPLYQVKQLICQILLNDWMYWTLISIGATVPQPLKRFSLNFQYSKHYYEVIGCLSVCLFICLRPISSDLAIFLLVTFCSREGFVQKNYGSGIWFLHKSGLINFPPFFLIFQYLKWLYKHVRIYFWNDFSRQRLWAKPLVHLMLFKCVFLAIKLLRLLSLLIVKNFSRY